MARLLITGGAGFIGSHTCVVLLEAGHELVVLDNFDNSSPEALQRVTELGGGPVQYREVQEHESARFLRYFRNGRLQYLEGGVASGFKHVVAEDRSATLLRLKGRGNAVSFTQVECKRSAMNSGDVFILDCGEGIFQWNGAASNGYERARAAEFVASLHEERAKATVELRSMPFVIKTTASQQKKDRLEARLERQPLGLHVVARHLQRALQQRIQVDQRKAHGQLAARSPESLVPPRLTPVMLCAAAGYRSPYRTPQHGR